MPFQHRHLMLLLYIALFLGIYFAITLLRNLKEMIFDPYPWEDYHHYTWTSPYTGWYNRSIAIPSPSDIHLNSSSLILLCQYSSWGHDWFNLALFTPDLCLTETGLLRLNSTDFAGIENLVTKARGVKETHYDMAPSMMDGATMQLHLPSESAAIKEYHAYAFHKGGSPKGADVMPDIMKELFGLVGYGEIGDWKVSDGDQVKQLLGEVVEIQASYGRRPQSDDLEWGSN